MLVSGVTLAAFVAVCSVTVSALALATVGKFAPRRRRTARGQISQDRGDSAVFLFDQRVLVDATRAAERLINAAPADGSDWTRLMSLLAPEFDDLAARLEGLGEDETVVFVSHDSRARLTAEWHYGLRRISLMDDDSATPPADVDIHHLNSMENELETLRATTDLAPHLVWRQDKEGTVTWFNRRYLDELRRQKGAGAADRWPVEPVFDPSAAAEAARQRTALRASFGSAETERWFEVHAKAVGDELLCWAIGVDAQVKASAQLRSFVQTFTRTFADLDAGLAIFDRSRRLTIFNPALADLTGLSPEFLAGKPALFAVLDRMRDLGRVPEPRNYGEWRRRVAELESDAAEGRFRETWPLPGGETLRVTGHPHPDGAVAFIVEDITAEVALTRRFRSEIEIGQSILDTMDDAVAVFSPSGNLAMCNAAYTQLWGADRARSVGGGSAVEAVQTWARLSVPSTTWARAAEFLASASARGPWSAEAMLLDGRAISCRFAPLAAGSTMATFAVARGLSGEVRFRRGA